MEEELKHINIYIKPTSLITLTNKTEDSNTFPIDELDYEDYMHVLETIKILESYSYKIYEK